MHKLAGLVMMLLALVMPCGSCAQLTPQQKSQAQAILDNALRDGEITQAQHAAATEALERDEPFDWETLGLVGLNLLLAFVGGPMVVRYQRGRPTQKVGLPERMIRKGGAECSPQK